MRRTIAKIDPGQIRTAIHPANAGAVLEAAAPLGIVDDSLCRFARFKLCAHLLDLRGLLFELGAQELNYNAFRCCVLTVWKSFVNRVIVASCFSTFLCSLRNSLSTIAFTAS